MDKIYFPLGKAQGDSFCNRQKEIEWVRSNIVANQHSLLIAPRRFGKSSLADKAIHASQLPVITLNFNTCADENDVQLLVQKGVSYLINKAIGPIENLLHSIRRYLKTLTPTIHLGPEYAHLELSSTQESNPVVQLEEIMLLLEKLLAEKKQRAVMLFDEFQTVGLIAKGKGVEAAIRNAIQSMTHLVIIFSGSNRSLLQLMFDDSARPLYKLCRKLHLQRIDCEHYRKHLNKIAKLTWGNELSVDVLDEIMVLSDRHPYYVNYLYNVIWTNNKKVPSVATVQDAWNSVLEEEASDAHAEIAHLSLNQRKVLRFIANYSGESLLSTNSIQALNLAQSSIAGAISGLLEKDMLEKDGHSYLLINPVIRDILKKEGLIEA